MNVPRRDDDVTQDHDPVEVLSYMAASRELDAIVEFFEKSEVDVDQLVAQLERATAIVDELDRRIRRTRSQVEELVPRLEAAGRVEAASVEQPGGARATGDGFDDPAPASGADAGESGGETLPF
jgi:exodeoxyribonuclease VII small subunit